MIPTYDEQADVLRPTVLGALGVRGTPTPEVWVLDDGDRAWVRELCEELGVRYLRRPAPRLHAKAGNLNHALEHVDADLILVVDADHVPLPHALERTAGYFDDPEAAFVQSPQVFFNRSFQHASKGDDPFLNEQSLFYDVICAGKDRNNATFWCGSSAVLRREALVAIGGIATETVVEDAHTAMRLHAAGWKSAYHPEVLAVGLAPEDVNAFVVQRGRWATGCYQLLRKENPLWLRGLSLRQRIHYTAAVQWAASVRHRRRAHRFPIRLDGYYTTGGAALPRVRATVTDLNTFGLALRTTTPVELGTRLDVAVAAGNRRPGSRRSGRATVDRARLRPAAERDQRRDRQLVLPAPVRAGRHARPAGRARAAGAGSLTPAYAEAASRSVLPAGSATATPSSRSSAA